MNYILCGPPGSGKTTYAHKHSKTGDIIVDLDAIFHAFTGLPLYEKPTNLLSFMLDIQQFVVEQISPDPDQNSFNNAWIILSGARASDRAYWQSKLNAKVILLDVPADECLRRIYADPQRLGNGIAWGEAIKKCGKTMKSNRYVRRKES